MDVPDDDARLDFSDALERLKKVVAELARARGVSVTAAIALDTPSFDRAPIRYRIDLKIGTGQVVVYIDHDALTDANECFAVLTVPQLDAAIGRLKRWVKQSVDSRPA